ncbi:hypothetical protein D3C75_948880 [compost metagenome]
MLDVPGHAAGQHVTNPFRAGNDRLRPVFQQRIAGGVEQLNRINGYAGNVVHERNQFRSSGRTVGLNDLLAVRQQAVLQRVGKRFTEQERRRDRSDDETGNNDTDEGEDDAGIQRFNPGTPPDGSRDRAALQCGNPTRVRRSAPGAV